MSIRKRMHRRSARRRRLRTAALLSVGLTLILVGGTAYHLTRPKRLAGLTARVLERATGVRVRIESAKLSWSGRLDVRGIRVGVRGLRGAAGEIFQAKQAMIGLNPRALLTEEPAVERIILVGPELSLTELPDGRYNYQLLPEHEEEPDGGADTDWKLPRITIHGGRLRRGEMREGTYRPRGRMNLSGRLAPAERAGRYRFELREKRDGAGPGQAGPTLTGHFDLNRLRAGVELAGFAFDDSHRGMLPQRIHRWWDRLNPSGTLPELRFTYDREAGPRAEVRVEGVSLTMPLLSEGGDRPRMTDVRGTFHFGREQVRIERLSGRIEGLRYAIRGVINGYRPDAPFHLSLKTNAFRVPGEADSRAAMPTPVRRVFRQLTPEGWVRVDAEVGRAKRGGRIRYEGEARILSDGQVLAALGVGGAKELGLRSGDLDSRGAYYRFPYPLTHCRGLIRFNERRLVIERLSGTAPGGSRVEITGQIGPMSDHPAMDLTLRAEDMPFDRTLRDALPEEQREALDMLLHRPSWRRLKKAGAFASPADPERHPNAGGGDGAGFPLGGRGDVVMTIERPAGPDRRTTVRAAVDLSGVRVVLQSFPYPVRIRSGRLILLPGRALLRDVRAEGIHGGSVRLSGRIDRPRDERGDRAFIPQIRLSARGMPIDGLLLDALPGSGGDWLHPLHASGRIDAEGRIFRDDTGRIDAELTLNMEGVSARLATPPRSSPAVASGADGGGLNVRGIAGRIHLTLNGLEIDRLTGRIGTGRISIRGGADWSGSTPSLRLRAAGHDLRFEQPLPALAEAAGLASQTLRSFWRVRKPAGAFDARFTYALDPKGAHYRANVRPHSLSFMHGGRRVHLRNAKGRIIVQPGEVRLKTLSGEFGGLRWKASGTARLGSQPLVRLAVRAVGNGVEPALGRAMPETIRGLLASLRPEGRFELKIPRLLYRPAAPPGRRIEANAELDLTDAAFNLGLPITGLDGVASIDLAPGSIGEGPGVRLALDARRARVAGRGVSDFHLAMHNEGGGERMLIPVLRGEMVGGRVRGEGFVHLGDGAFRLRAVLDGGRLGSFLAAREARKQATRDGGGPPARAIRGVLSASLAMEGSWKTPSSVRGLGEARARRVAVRDMPLTLGLLQLSHLTVPLPTRFHRAELRYHFRDDRLEFDDLRIDAPALRLAGRGWMQYATGALDLTLTTDNPRGLDLGPITGLIDAVRDQLITLRVTGTAARPRINGRPLSALTEALEDLFASRNRDGLEK